MPGRGRGRGRGGRGSAGWGGRGGRSGGGGRGRSGSADRDDNRASSPSGKEGQELDLKTNLKSYFRGTVSFEQHYDAQEEDKVRYSAGLAVLSGSGVLISQNARVRALAAAWARHDHDMANALLECKSSFGLVEVLKALTLLDSTRRIRIHEKKLKRLQLSGSKVTPAKLGKLKSDIDNLRALAPKCGSASGAVCKHVRRWVQRFSKDDLEFYALHYPVEPWKKLADICHFNPEKDFKELSWFLPFCFGDPAPEGTMVRRCRTVAEDSVNLLIEEFPVPFSHVKQFKANLTANSKARIASYTKSLDHVIWNYEDLQCAEVDEIIEQRIRAGETISLPNGKLLERLLTLKMIRENIPARFSHFHSRKKSKKKATPSKVPFLKDLIPIAEKRLKDISLPLESPIVVIGDASGSMEVAIRTSTIIASLLTAITSARLVFFNTENRVPPFLPKTIEEVLELAVTTEASGGTAPAASLYPFYEQKEVVKTFIVVTDEEENSPYKKMMFDELFKKYHTEVYPSRLVFVSFLRGQHARGDMVSKLADYKPLQFKLDSSRPDLTKLDTLFGLLSSESASFDDQVAKLESDIRANGLGLVFQNIVVEADEGDKK